MSIGLPAAYHLNGVMVKRCEEEPSSINKVLHQVPGGKMNGVKLFTCWGGDSQRIENNRYGTEGHG